jgi:hypothetical protein
MPQSRTYASGRTDRQLSLREGRKWIVLRRYRTNTCRSTRSNDWTIFPHRLLCGAHCATAVSSSDSRRSTFEFHTSWLMNSMQQLFSGSSIDAAQRRTFHKPPLREPRARAHNHNLREISRTTGLAYHGPSFWSRRADLSTRLGGFSLPAA